MKNTHLLRLAGLGIFSAAFLSPTPQQEVLVKISPALSKSFANNIILNEPFKLDPVLTDYKPEINNILYIEPAIDQKVTVSHRPEFPASRNNSRDDHIASHSTLLSTENSADTTTEVRPANAIDGETYYYADTTIQESILIYRPVDDSTQTDEPVTASASQQLSEKTDESMLNPPKFYLDETTTQKILVKSQTPVAIINKSKEAGIDAYPDDLLIQRIDRLIELSEKQGCSGDFAFIINLGLRSGKKRFHIVDLKNKSVITSGLVAHGKGAEKFTLNKKYSNLNGSSCSSLGLYKLGASYTGSFGKSFRLIGLEKSNNNALARSIVLHSMGCIPDEEIEYPICQSEGCPSVSPQFFKLLTEKIATAKSPVLLWIFDPLVE